MKTLLIPNLNVSYLAAEMILKAPVDSSAKCNTTKLLRQFNFLGSLSKI